MSNPGKPDLDRLVTALTADGHPDELTGRDAAAAAFRSARRRGAAAGRARRHGRLSPRLASAGAVLAVAAGIAAAAYVRALPGPAQDVAHTVFAPLGVPGNQQSGHPAAVTIATSGGTSRTASPRAGGDYRLTLAASRLRVPAGAVVEFGGRVTADGAGAAGVPVRLFERLAGSTTWQLAASGVTGPRGGFRLTSPPLTATAVFRVVGPGAKHSAAVRITVLPSASNGVNLPAG